MIGRGTRLCPNLLGEGMDKERFLIFDFCNNFEYFRVNKNGAENGITESLNEKIYNTKAQIVRELQAPVYSGDEIYADYRKSLAKNQYSSKIPMIDVTSKDFPDPVSNQNRYELVGGEIKKWMEITNQPANNKEAS